MPSGLILPQQPFHTTCTRPWCERLASGVVSHDDDLSVLWPCVCACVRACVRACVLTPISLLLVQSPASLCHVYAASWNASVSLVVCSTVR